VKHRHRRPDPETVTETATETMPDVMCGRPDSSTTEQTPATVRPGDDAVAGRHGLHHDESIDTEHEPFSVISQRCRGEYP
jgi:hypothetical protein